MTQHTAASRCRRALLLGLLCLGASWPAGASRAAEPALDILVVAPHSDDEAIGCATVILRALRDGKRVGIVVVTNGDGHARAAAAIAGKPVEELAPEDFIRLTATRQQHTLTAMTGVGVPAEEIVFLGYPDVGLKQVYAADAGAPVRQRYTLRDETYGVVTPDYHTRVHGRPAPYVRESVIGDMAEILRDRRPAEIYVTNERDTHDEHEATFWVVRDAARAAAWQGTLWTFVVHGSELPSGEPRRVSLTPEELDRKREILTEYGRHMSPVHDDLPDRYAKPEELFWPVPVE